MNFLRHVGKHGDRKVAIVFREVPGETHMCLVTYTELLNQNIHDPMIACIESGVGQNCENLADALNKSYTKDGKIILHVLHMEGQLKKVNTEQIIVTPAPNVKIKLNELNAMLDEMQKGEEATKKLQEMDNSLGMTGQAEFARNLMKKDSKVVQESNTAMNALDDSSLANNLRRQAERMSAEAKGLLAEADRLMKEAAIMEPMTVPEAPKTRGRKPKVK